MAGLSRRQLADRSRVPVETIKGVERHGAVPNLKTAQLLSRSLHLTTDELFPTGELKTE